MVAKARDSTQRGAVHHPTPLGLCIVDHADDHSSQHRAPPRCAPMCEILRTLPCALLVVDHEGCIIVASHEAAWTLGVESQQLEGRPIAEIFAPIETLQSSKAHQEASL